MEEIFLEQKKIYNSPQVEVIGFDCEDVIRTSTGVEFEWDLDNPYGDF